MSKRKSFWEVDSDNARSQRATRRAKRKRMHLPLIYSEDVQKAVAKYLGKKTCGVSNIVAGASLSTGQSRTWLWTDL